MLKLCCILCCIMFLSQAKKLCLYCLYLINYTEVFFNLFFEAYIVADDADVFSLFFE